MSKISTTKFLKDYVEYVYLSTINRIRWSSHEDSHFIPSSENEILNILNSESINNGIISDLNSNINMYFDISIELKFSSDTECITIINDNFLNSVNNYKGKFTIIINDKYETWNKRYLIIFAYHYLLRRYEFSENELYPKLIHLSEYQISSKCKKFENTLNCVKNIITPSDILLSTINDVPEIKELTIIN